MKTIITALFLGLSAASPSVAAAEFHLAPSGNDNNPGTAAQP